MQIPSYPLANGATIPALGFGTYQIPAGAETVSAVSTALKAGYRSIDTAKVYGNEAGVGEAVAASDIGRADLFITTKLWNSDQGYESTLQAFETSLGELGMDYVDLYLVHWYKPQTSLETWRAMEEIYTSGRAKSIGVSNYQIAHLEELATSSKVVPMVNQIELHPRLQQLELREYHAAHGIVTEAWSPLMQAGQLLKDQVITGIASAHDKSAAQVILRWHVQLGNVVIPKSVTPERIQANADIFDFELSPTEMDSIATLDDGTRIGPDPDHVTF